MPGMHGLLLFFALLQERLDDPVAALCQFAAKHLAMAAASSYSKMA
jgi:hypothetical protein